MRTAGEAGKRLTTEILSAGWGVAPDALAPLLTESPERRRQVEAFARLDSIMEIGSASPSGRAADIVLSYATK